MNELLEKAKRDYPIGTKIKGVYKDVAYIVSKNTFIRYENIYTIDENGDDIVATAGMYRVILNTTEGTYTMNALQ